MSKNDIINKLEFTHFVIAAFDEIIFAAARFEGRIENFVFDVAGRWARQQVGSNHYEYLSVDEAHALKRKAEKYYTKVPTYRTKRFVFN